jgi:hypothetical protein
VMTLYASSIFSTQEMVDFLSTMTQCLAESRASKTVS